MTIRAYVFKLLPGLFTCFLLIIAAIRNSSAYSGVSVVYK